LRRRALNMAARKHDATKLALGHNLDDEAQTILMNVLRADLERIYRLDPRPVLKHPKLVPRIKPLREIPEKETSLYLYHEKLPFHSVECPYTPMALRRQIQSVLNELEAKNPTIKFNLLRFFDKLHPILQEHPPLTKSFKICSKCGEITNATTCKYCLLIEQILDDE
ncbi:MAG: TIGR00269 family protein, partial [Candidatus Helarchaeales archaeon]